jgi:prevent-host-death family protein
MRTIAAGEFKAKCLGLMDEVQTTGQTVFITKRGKPIAQLGPIGKVRLQMVTVDSIFDSLRGMITVTGNADGLVEPFIPLEEWDHLKEDWSPFPPE